MDHWVLKIKEKRFAWHVVNFFLDGIAFLLDAYYSLRKKNSAYLSLFLPNNFNRKIPEHRVQKHYNILFYSPNPTYPISHGNRTRMSKLIEKFTEMGHKVHFVMLQNFECNKESFQGMRHQFTTLDIIPCKKIWFSLGKTPFDAWYVDGIGEHIRVLCSRYDIDLVLCSYVWQSKLLEFVPDHVLKVIDTHDKMGNRYEMLRRNKLPTGQFSCTPEEEGTYLRRADLVIGITDEEAKYFAEVSCQKTLMISHIEKPKFLKKDFSSLRHVGIVASRNRFNLSMVSQCLHRINQMLADKEMNLPFVVHLVGGIKKAVAFRMWNPKMHIFKKPWVIMHGFVPNVSEFYSQMDLILSPMMCGTGINIKTVEAMAHGMPLLSTVHGSRGMDLHDAMHNHQDIDTLVHSLFALSENPIPELQRLADLSRTNYMQFYEKNESNCNLLFEHAKLPVFPHNKQ